MEKVLKDGRHIVAVAQPALCCVSAYEVSPKGTPLSFEPIAVYPTEHASLSTRGVRTWFNALQ